MENRFFNFLILAAVFLFCPKLSCSTLTVTNPSGDVLTLDGDYFLGGNSAVFMPYHEIIIDNTSGGAATATLDGNGHTVYFPYNTATPTFSFITNPVDLTLTDVKLQGYDPDAVTFLSTSKFIFGDDSRIILDKNLSIDVGDTAWNCSGNAVIDGMSFTLTVSGDEQLICSGAGKELTLKNLTLRPQQSTSIANQDATATITFQDSKLELYRDGMAIEQGDVDIEGVVCVRGIDKSMFVTPNQAELEKRFEGLGFGLFDGHTEPTTFSLGVSDDSTFTAVRINKEDKAFYTENTDPYAVTWTEILGTDYLSIDVGTDGQIWVIKTDNTVHRVTKGGPPTLTAATGQNGDYITVGSADHVFILNSSGEVYKNDDPTGTPTSWTQVTGVVSPTSIAAGSDGTLWFIDPDGRIQKKDGDNIEVVSEGIGRAFQKVSAAGTKDTNFVAALSSGANGGRVVISKDNGPFRDLGIFKVTDIGIGEKGSMMSTFDSDLISEDPTFGRPIYSNIKAELDPILTMDKTFTFSSLGTMTVRCGSELKFEDGAELRHQPDVTGESTIQERKRHFVLEDLSATLGFDCASLNTGSHGLALEQGTIVFKGLNHLHSSTVANKQFELGTAVEAVIKDGAQLNVMGPMDYVPTSEMASGVILNSYYTFVCASEAQVKAGVVDGTTLQAITDAYAAGFKAPGSVVDDWDYDAVAIIDTDGPFTADPMLFTTRGAPASDQYLMDIKTATRYARGKTGNPHLNVIDLAPDGYMIVDISPGSVAAAQIPPDISMTTETWIDSTNTDNTFGQCASINSGLFVVGIRNTDGLQRTWSGPTLGTLGGGGSSAALAPKQPIAGGTDGTIWYIRNDLVMRKRLPSTAESTIAYPGTMTGNVHVLSAHGDQTSHYVAIATTTGQAFFYQDDGAWQDLSLTAVLDICIGTRGSIAALLQADPGLHTYSGISVIRPGE